MSNAYVIKLESLKLGSRVSLPYSGYVEKTEFNDSYGSIINILTISNGLLAFTILLERGMDIGCIFYGEEKISWNRREKYLLNPDNVNLYENNNTGWEKGFYAAVAAIGPEIFGTPDEVRTVHGTGSYSKAALESVRICCDEEQILVEGVVPIQGYSEEQVYEKTIRISTKYEESIFIRQDITRNLTGISQPLDDGYHIQLAGEFTSKIGRYILPVAPEKMLLRDSAPKEQNPLEIYDFRLKLDPIRCYQYIPEPVSGLVDIKELRGYQEFLEGHHKVTAEMIVNSEKSTAAFVIRPLDSYPRSLIAKRVIEEPMYALEPCRTRPNSMRQKTIDGEVFCLKPYSHVTAWVLIGVTKSPLSISKLENVIVNSTR